MTVTHDSLSLFYHRDAFFESFLTILLIESVSLKKIERKISPHFEDNVDQDEYNQNSNQDLVLVL